MQAQNKELQKQLVECQSLHKHGIIVTNKKPYKETLLRRVGMEGSEYFQGRIDPLEAGRGHATPAQLVQRV